MLIYYLRKAKNEMNRKTLPKVFLWLGVIMMALAILFIATSQSAGQANNSAPYIEQLENLLNPNYKNYLDSQVMFQLPEGVKDDDEISVIITLDTDSMLEAYKDSGSGMSISEFILESDEADEIRNEISRQKLDILSELTEKGVNFTVGENYTTVLSGFEIIIKAKDFESTCKSLGDGQRAILGEEYHVAETELVENTVNVYETGIFNGSNSWGYDGSGVVVAVLDTGLDYSHSAFDPSRFTSDTLGLTYDKVASVIASTAANRLVNGGLTASDVYINEKVPFGFDYADNDSDVYSTHNNHGTHVSGVIVGKDDTITGVAPNAQLVSMKIFSDVKDTARSAWILAALEDCVKLGVDVINMSLGTACGFSRESDEEVIAGVYDQIREAGISLVVAASNSYNSAYGSESNGNLGLTSNPDTGTVGSPSTYEGAMSVASINGAETPYILYGSTIIYFLESTNGATEENDFCETLLGNNQSIELEYVVVPGVGRAADYTGIDVEGKIALVRRGSNTFEEKALIAESFGAAGIIIYNNVSGDIKMNVGEATLAVCSISQDDGEMLAAAGGGTIRIDATQSSGPFMSDFSSWGPTPSLGIKPEITAHGGNILSSVTGGGYDRLSGTSMACPNLAGVTILLRQYVSENHPELVTTNGEIDNVKLAAVVNCLMMSTADIIYNQINLPYSVRKQGAGLANLISSIETTAFIRTYNEDGTVMDKTKLELGDDESKAGVYELNFTIHNFGTTSLTYDLSTIVLTEGVSDTKTSHGETTVTEEGYLLTGAVTEILSVDGANPNGTSITVSANDMVDVSVRISLSDADKDYLDRSFENGMYVEGFVILTATDGTDIDLSVPFLAFYGDWEEAPLFDLDYYETNADELNDALEIEDKVMPDAYATRPIGGVSEDYVSYLGSYYFVQDPSDIVISASRDYIALSNKEGTVHSLRFVWAGLLRNAERIVITITDDTTGEVVFTRVEDDIRKSYGDGGAMIYPANVKIEFDTQDYNLANNSEYTVRLEGYLDTDDGGHEDNDRSVFEFPLVIDFEAPVVENVEYRYQYDKKLKKNRLFADVYLFDNHYAMALQTGYAGMGTDENGDPITMLYAFEQFLTPVYSDRNSTTKVTVELTDYIYQIKHGTTPRNRNTFTVTAYDYALNYAVYEIGLPDELTDFYLENSDGEMLTDVSSMINATTDLDALLEEINALYLNVNELYTLDAHTYPDVAWSELLNFSSSDSRIVRVVNNKLVACGAGNAVVTVTSTDGTKSTQLLVHVYDEDEDGYRFIREQPVCDTFDILGYEAIRAYFRVANTDRDIGQTGDVRFFEGRYSLKMFPSESVLLSLDFTPYFEDNVELVYESSNENIVTVDDQGRIVAEAEGYASITVSVRQNGKSTTYSKSISIEVKDPFLTTGATLSNYYGLGGTVTIPERLHLKEIGSFAFSNFEYIPKEPWEMTEDEPDTTKMWYIGDNTITRVIIPEGVEKINSYAFANLTALTEVVLPSTLESIEYGAFYGCTSLSEITFSGEDNVKIINQNAFENCALEDELSFESVCVISDYAFAGNKKLEKITLGESAQSIGKYAFAGCERVTEVSIGASKVKYGDYAFTGCKKLTSFGTVNAQVIPAGMFYECKELETVTIGADVIAIGEFAFKDTSIEAFELDAQNTAFKTANEGRLLVSADETKLVAVSPAVSGAFTMSLAVTAIERGAFSHNEDVTSVTLPNVTYVSEYAFAHSKRIANVSLGTLTYIGDYAFFETAIAELPSLEGVSTTGKYAFAYTKITSVAIPDGFEIAEGVFSDCPMLNTIVIGDDVVVGKFAFTCTHMIEGEDTINYEIKSYLEGGKKYFYYEFKSPITSITIGENAIIGDSAFMNAASVETVTLGDGAQIGYMAFYNCSSLEQINLEGAVSIGDYAFSGDVRNVCQDMNMSLAAISSDNQYIYSYHGPVFTEINLEGAESIGAYSFAYTRELKRVNLGEGVLAIPEYAFAGCNKLEQINLEGVSKIGNYAFMESGLIEIDLSSASIDDALWSLLERKTAIGDYAFVNCLRLEKIILSEDGASIGEGAFAYCDRLDEIIGLEDATIIGDYAFAYTALTEADLTSATYVGTHAFMKESLTYFDVTLGESIVSMGDNPFAMCRIDPLFIISTESFNGVDYNEDCYTFDLSDTVHVIDGSLYCDTPNGLELITYTGIGSEHVILPEGTVRVTAMAFAGSDVIMVTLPHSLRALGHKAFYQCNSLEIVEFKSYDAPNLEEEYDESYYFSYEHIPGTGYYGSYNNNGVDVDIYGIGLIPYYMYNAASSETPMYSNVYYGASFIDYVGYVSDSEKLLMIRPSNGEHYETFITSQYFRTVLDGDVAADDITYYAIQLISALPDVVELVDRDAVRAARAAYNRVASPQQIALVAPYLEKLQTAEQRITALEALENQTPTPPSDDGAEEPKKEKLPVYAVILIVVCSVVLAGVLSLNGYVLVKKYLEKKKNEPKDPEEEAKRLAEKEAKKAEKEAKKAEKEAIRAEKEAKKRAEAEAKRAEAEAKSAEATEKPTEAEEKGSEATENLETDESGKTDKEEQ